MRPRYTYERGDDRGLPNAYYEIMDNVSGTGIAVARAYSISWARLIVAALNEYEGEPHFPNAA